MSEADLHTNETVSDSVNVGDYTLDTNDAGESSYSDTGVPDSTMSQKKDESTTKKSSKPSNNGTASPKTNGAGAASPNGESTSQRNAVQKAKSYLEYLAFSYEGLIQQLEKFEQFTHEQAKYGADHCGANW